MSVHAARALALGLAAAVTLAGAAAQAQPTSAFQGMQQNRNDPINIEAATLEVRDKEKIAIFIDNVKVVQGDTTLECKRLTVFYDEEPQPNAAKGGKRARPASAPGTGPAPGQQQIRRLEAKGGVVVTQKDQVATGDNAVYDMKTNSIVIMGSVVVTQGQNVLRGDRLYVDMTSGVSRVESGATGQSGRVQGLFLPSSMKDRQGAAQQSAPAPSPATTGSAPAPQAASPQAAAPRPAERRTPQPAPRPLKVN